jgi:hypothetical protein
MYLNKILENIFHIGTMKLCLDVEIVSLQEVCLYNYAPQPYGLLCDLI